MDIATAICYKRAKTCGGWACGRSWGVADPATYGLRWPRWNARKAPLAGSSSRQQRRSSPQGAEEEDAARGHIPGDEAPELLRETLREARSRAGRGRATRAQACPQARAARGAASR